MRTGMARPARRTMNDQGHLEDRRLALTICCPRRRSNPYLELPVEITALGRLEGKGHLIGKVSGHHRMQGLPRQP
jgi:hypothetical protein